MNDVIIRSDLRPGDLGRLIALHGTAYQSEAEEYGVRFEAFVARTVADYLLGGDDGRIWFAEQGERLVATAALVERRDEDRPQGQLRWVLADPIVRGQGIGKELIGRALDYAERQGLRQVYLETTDGLDSSMHIYRQFGFEVVSREEMPLWRPMNTVITMVRS